MTAKEQLWYLVRGVVSGIYELNTFCDEIYRIYNFETDESQLTELEWELFGTLFKMQGRYSEFEEDLKIPNMYITGEELLQMAKTVVKYDSFA